MSAETSLDSQHRDWERRKAITTRYGRSSLIAAFLLYLLFVIAESSLPKTPNAESGHVFPILWATRTYGYGPLFVYGTQLEQWFELAVAIFAISLFTIGCVVYYKFNPTAFYRTVKSKDGA